MSPLVRKEIRLLLTPLTAATILAVFPAQLLPERTFFEAETIYPLLIASFAFGAAFLALAPFGQESSMGMFPQLLSQPVDRKRLWALKGGLITVALLVITAAFLLSVNARVDSLVTTITHDRWNNSLKVAEQVRRIWDWRIVVQKAMGIALPILAGGVCLTLLLRHVVAAFVFSLAAPLTIVTVTSSLPAEVSGPTSTALLTLYTCGTALLAWRQFLGAEDIVRWNWTASLEDFRPRRSLVAAKPRHWKPLLTLFRREISLHQVSLLIACGILLFHLIDLGLRAFGGLSQGSDALFILEGAPLLWLSLPWIIGGTAVAEERRQGTLESELCLPVTRRRQFAVKLVVAVALGVFLGVIVPFAVEAIGMAFDINSTLFAGELRFWDRDNALVKLFTPIYGPIWARFEPAVFRVLLEFFYWVAVAVISSLLAFSCSTLARHTLQSLAATAILGASLALFVVWSLGQPILGTGALFLLIAGPVLLATLVRLGLRNYQTLMPEQRLWLRSVATIGIAALLVETATAFVYPRPWEWLFPPEPRPGPHRLQGSVVPLLCGGQERLLALLPDGRIWRATNYVKEVVITPGRDTWMFDRNEKWAPTNGEFLDGQWNDLVCFESNAVYALKSDGTLWSIWSLGGVLQFDQLGSDSDWRSIASGGRRMFGWKKDGSRWVWGISDEPRRAATGPDEIQRSARELADISLGPPTRRSDWIFITYFGDTLTALAADGAVCAWRDPPLTYHPYDYRNRGILAPSRRPAWCLNVLDTL